MSPGEISPKWLFHIPKGYVDLISPKHAFPDVDGEKYFFSCKVISMRRFTDSGGTTQEIRKTRKLVLELQDDRGNVAKSTIFGMGWEWKDIKPEQYVLLYGKTSYWQTWLQINEPVIVKPDQVGKIIPQYRPQMSGEKFSGEAVGAKVRESLILIDEAAQLIMERLRIDEAEFVGRFGTTPAAFLASVHTPNSVEEGLEAAFVAERIAIDGLIFQAMENRRVVENKQSIIFIEDSVISGLAARLPYPLTNGQRKVISEIVSDLRSSYPMRRVLSGDVGTGKTIAFMLPAIAAFNAGKVVGIMTPNQVLVDQISREMKEFFPEIPQQVVRPKGKEVLRPDGGIIIGTTSILFATSKAGIDFDLVITDEQHKFSVDQKYEAVSGHTNLLEATATPIPRSIALVGCNGMSLSILDECPVKKNVISLLVGEDKKRDLLSFIQKTIQSGQVAIVYAAVNESEEVSSIRENSEKWEKLFPGQIATLHGQLPDKEKLSAISAMLSGEKKILVASTVIELGVTLPDLRALIVVDPDMFGVSQLHQLRGRIARRGGTGHFIMYARRQPAPAAIERLKAVKETNDGFLLAEKDMEQRGFGDIGAKGESQTGDAKLIFHGLNIPFPRMAKAISRYGAGA